MGDLKEKTFAYISTDRGDDSSKAWLTRAKTGATESSLAEKHSNSRVAKLLKVEIDKKRKAEILVETGATQHMDDETHFQAVGF